MVKKYARPIVSETYVAKVMPFRLGTIDMIAIYVIALFWINNAANAAAGGVVSIIYLLLGALTCFFPCVIATAQLGVLFPHEGSLYNWTSRALGRFWGMLIGFFLWLAGVLAIVAGADTFATYLQGLNNNWLSQPWQQGLLIMVVIIFSAALACQRVATSQYLVKFAACFIAGVVVLVGLSALVWLLTGQHVATNFQHSADWSITPDNYSLFGLITLLYLGTNIPLNMGGEVSGRRVVTQHLLWGALFVVVSYLVVTFAILVVRGPAILQTAVLPIEVVTTVDLSLGKVWGNIVTLGILLFFVMVPMVYTAASSRILFAMAVDHWLPEQLTKYLGTLNRHRVPARAIFLQTCLAIFFTAVAFVIAPYLVRLGSPQDLANKVYFVSAASVEIVWTLATIFLFVDVSILALRHAATFSQVRIVPVPLLWASCVIGPVACVLAIVGTIWYSWDPPLIDNTQWLLWVSGFTLAVIVVSIVGVLFASAVAESSEMWRELDVPEQDFRFEDFRAAVEAQQVKNQT